jgi:CRISPR-associated endoribonuclease Cas6
MGTEVEGSAPWRLSWLAEREPPSLPTTVVFGDARCPVSSTTVRRVSYAELAGSAPVGHAHLRVTSPMFFSRNGRDHPLPDPGLMLRSAATRWNRHAPAALAVPDDALRELAKLIYLADFEGRTARVPVSATMSQTGYVGEVHLALVRIADRSARVTFAALTRFAALAGLGAQTTHGFGAVDMLEPAR